ncbi:RidA family protein [Photorhabdus asymbiotica]|uniref:RidA family protein n=1 Tax=Photorhabdus asymbiotica TaxID=291112 RepID=UPI003DA7277A
MIKTIDTKNAPAATGPYSQGKQINNVIYLSGQIPINPITGGVQGITIIEQTEQVIANIKAILKSVDLSLDSVLKTMCFLTDMAHFAEFNSVYEKYFVSKPARSCIAVKQLPKNALIEIEIIALAESVSHCSS